jgi:signal transduction histidine kinase
MLAEFITDHRELLLTRARTLMATGAGNGNAAELLEHLRLALQRSMARGESDHSELAWSAGKHGHALYLDGVTVAQVVHDYGSLCQVITGLAAELNTAVPVEEFQTLNLCLDEAIAAAVTEFARQKEGAISAEGAERLGTLAHEVRNYLNTAMLALASIRKGVVAIGGSTGNILERSLVNLQTLVDRSFADVRLQAGLHVKQRIQLSDVIDELQIGATMSAESNGLRLLVPSVERGVIVEADAQLLTAAITNLLQNAFKFSPSGTTVTLRANVGVKRVLVEVEDECGGLPTRQKESLLRPFVQRGEDRSGLGLGLSICVKSMQAFGGELRVRDLPGKGCVFTLDLLRLSALAT